MGYWRALTATAAKQALKDAKLDSVASAVIILLAQALVAVGFFVVVGQFTQANAITRALTALTPFLTFPVAFVIRAILLPAVLDQELRATIESLKNPPPPERYDDGIYQHGTLVGIVSDPREAGHQIEFGAVENSDGLRRQEAFFYRDRLLLLDTVSQYAASQTSLTITAEGPISQTRKAVMTGVRCRIIGSVGTVR
jgi:membrane protein implicated in regulation of membrane protease activity